MRVLDDWLLTPARAAVHLPTATAVIADVHLGYGEARQRGGDAVPSQTVAAVFAPLAPILAAHTVRRLVIAGDLFETGRMASLATEVLAWCAAVRIELFGVVPGNHDRGLAVKAPELPIYPEGLTLGRWQIVHGDEELPQGCTVQGHEHPFARWGRDVGGPCFLIAERRLILPAFSPDAAGVNVLRAERWQDFRCYVIAGKRLLDFGEVGKIRAKAAGNK
jgi:putative SbcD/Mre11-related phosphoesterase